MRKQHFLTAEGRREEGPRGTTGTPCVSAQIKLHGSIEEYRPNRVVTRMSSCGFHAMSPAVTVFAVGFERRIEFRPESVFRRDSCRIQETRIGGNLKAFREIPPGRRGSCRIAGKSHQ